MKPLRITPSRPLSSGHTAKTLRCVIQSVAEEWVCPITQELPLDPVTAEDGRVYERNAIESWMSELQSTGRPLRSPITNQSMGPYLLPAPHVHNAVKTMVQCGALSEGTAEAWTKRLADEEEVEAIRKAAENGDGEACSQLAGWYTDGRRGFQKDYQKAFWWYRRGADLGDAYCMSNTGDCYCIPFGTEKNTSMAIFYYTRSACAGSETGCFRLGNVFLQGALGSVKDKEKAATWFRKMLSCATKDTHTKIETYRMQARVALEAMRNGEEAVPANGLPLRACAIL